MKKTLLILALMATVLSVNAQRVSSRAKAVRMLAYARPEYQVKDVKVYADTMTVFSGQMEQCRAVYHQQPTSVVSRKRLQVVL